MDVEALYARWLALPEARRLHYVTRSLREDVAMALLRRITDEHARHITADPLQRRSGVIDTRPLTHVD